MPVARGDRFPRAAVVGFGLLLLALVAARRPDVLLRPQFWAEDGAFFYADAYNHGWLTGIAHPYNGFLHALPRVVAGLALLFPVRLGPAVFNWCAVLVEVSPAVFLLTGRLAWAIPDRRLRLVLALVYISLPDSAELHANMANSVSLLPILALMVFLADAPLTRAWRVFDVLVVGICALTGPLVLPLVPAAALRTWFSRSRWHLGLMALLAVGAVVQAAVLLGPVGARSSAPLGASPGLLVRIVSGQVFTAGLCGVHCYARVYNLPAWNSPWLPLLVLVPLGCLVTLGCIRGNQAVRVLCLFAATVLAAALLKPQVSLSAPQWPLLTTPGVAQRYFHLPIMAVVTCLVVLALRPGWWPARSGAVAVLALFVLLAIPRDFFLPPYTDHGWNARVAAFERSAPGSTTRFPLNPDGWRMDLVRRAAP